MKSWPQAEIPPISVNLPKLNLRSTWGSAVDRKIFNSYICGITPYDATHLGHAATYITFDLIHRYQVLQGKELNFTENITDVDDPLLERAHRDSVDWKALAENQTDLFQRDMTALRVLPPSTFLAVSETIGLVENGLQKLKANDAIYELDGDFYFDVSDFLDALPLPLEEAIHIFGERGGDPNRFGKRNALDPLMWRKNVSGEPGWQSDFGFGRPGWHIECAVIAIKGATKKGELEPILDMQGGGRDLIFPHHFMTKIIVEKLANRDFAAQYVHTGLLGFNGEKMSKSLGNLVFVHELLNSGVDPMAIRLALLSGKYSEDRMWTDGVLDQANSLLEKMRKAFSKIEVAETTKVIADMIEAISDDLNTPKAISILSDWCDQTLSGGTGSSPGSLSRFIDSALGLAI